MKPNFFLPGTVLGLITLISMQCVTTRNIGGDSVTVAFYNVENLFDTVDDPNHADEDFTPDGKQQWDTERYLHKLGHLTDVIAAMGHPGIMGFAEVENRSVLADLCQTGSMREQGYQIAHFESPDHRGIDVALIFQAAMFTEIESRPISVTVDDPLVKDYTTRDILYTQLKSAQGKTLHVIVNHWPSRRDGPEISEARRMQVARQTRAVLDEIQKNDPEGYFVVMGDFNDEPTDRTLREVMGAGSNTDQTATLFNAMWELDQEKKGSYYYRGDWNMLDQIILSKNFLAPKGLWTYDSTTVFSAPFMFYNDPKNGPLPNRTYGGTRYFGGYSDHLPVMVEVRQ